MDDGFAVQLVALRDDAHKWADWSSRIEAREESVETTLDPWAFSDQPGFEEVAAAYNAKLNHVRLELSSGVRALRAIADRLEVVAAAYETAEAQSEAIVARAHS